MKKRSDFKLYGIFGYPLSHTRSPEMQEAAFEKAGIKAFYVPFELKSDSLIKETGAICSEVTLF